MNSTRIDLKMSFMLSMIATYFLSRGVIARISEIEIFEWGYLIALYYYHKLKVRLGFFRKNDDNREIVAVYTDVMSDSGNKILKHRSLDELINSVDDSDEIRNVIVFYKWNDIFAVMFSGKETPSIRSKIENYMNTLDKPASVPNILSAELNSNEKDVTDELRMYAGPRNDFHRSLTSNTFHLKSIIDLGGNRIIPMEESRMNIILDDLDEKNINLSDVPSYI